MIRDSREKTAWACRNIKDAPILKEESDVDVTLFHNYYGTVKKSHQFNDPTLYSNKNWFFRLIDEIKAIRIVRRKK